MVRNPFSEKWFDMKNHYMAKDVGVTKIQNCHFGAFDM
jgi:hypothetical protein